MRGFFSSLFLCVILAAQAATADTNSVPFPQGFAGTRGSNAGQANNIVNFSTLGVSQAYFIQTSESSSFGGTQGNDLSGTLRLVFSNGQAIGISGAINWRITQGSTLHYFGFIPAPDAATHVITYGNNQQYILNAGSNYGLRKIGSPQTYADGTNVSGNAALSGLLTELNDYLTAVRANGPQITGPSGITGSASSTTQVYEDHTSVATLTADKTVTWSIFGGIDAGSFVIGPTTGVLAFVVAPDFEAPTDTDENNGYVVTIQATDGSGYTAQQTLTVTVADLDDTPPVITGPVAVAVSGGQTAVASFTTDETVSWSLGGPDAAAFTVGVTGTLNFVTAPDHDAPADDDQDGMYEITLRATDAAGNVSSQPLTVTVIESPPDDVMPPIITGPSDGIIAVPEGQIVVMTFTADEPVAWSIGGDDAAAFTIDPITGALSFAAAPDHAAPVDADGDNIYLFTIVATDPAGNVSRQSLSVTVMQATPDDLSPPAINGPIGGWVNVVEGQVAVTDLLADEPVTWAIGGGADAALFVIDAQTGRLQFVEIPVFEAPQDADGDNTYLVTLSATDASSNSSQQTLYIAVTRAGPSDTVPPVIAGPSGPAAVQSVSIGAEQTLVADFAADEAVLWSLAGADAALFALDPMTGVLTYIAVAPDAGTGDYLYAVSITATDAAGNTSTVVLEIILLGIAETASEVFADHRDALAEIVQEIEVQHLRISVASLARLTASARDRFIATRDRQDRCRANDNGLTIAPVDQSGIACRPVEKFDNVPFAIEGQLYLDTDRYVGTGSFFGQNGNDAGGRRLIFGEFAVLGDGAGVETSSVTARMAWERQLSDDIMLGYFIGGSFARATIANDLTGVSDKVSLSVGSYFVTAIDDDLYVDGFLAVEASRNRLALGNDDININGPYHGRSMLAGLALTGVVPGDGFELRPEISWAYGKTRIGTLDVTATTPEMSEDVTALIEGVSYASVRITPEVRLPVYDDAALAHYILAPSLVCDWTNGDSDCGAGLRMGLQGNGPDQMTEFDIMLDADRIGPKTTLSLRANILFRF